MNYRGGLFVLEGPDGGGKTTQYQRALQYLQRTHDAVGFREPGGTRLGEKIRGLLLDPENTDMNAMTELLLFSASRAQLFNEAIKPALEAGRIVMLDRFAYASHVYQGVAGNVGISSTMIATRLAIGEFSPTKIYVLDVSPEIAAKRMTERKKDRFEERDQDYHRKVREGYLSLAKLEPDKTRIISTDSLNEEQVHKIIIKDIEKCIKEKGLEDRLLRKTTS